MTPSAFDALQPAAGASSPLERFLRAFDRLDADACAAMFAADGRLRFADGGAEEGITAVRERLRDYFADLRATEHVLGERWHFERVWIGEVEATYTLADDSRSGPVSKVFVMRMRDGAIQDLRVYAAGEPSFHEAVIRHERDRIRGLLVGGRWMPPL